MDQGTPSSPSCQGSPTPPFPSSRHVQFLALEGLLDGKLKFRPMTLPDRYIEHGTQGEQMAEAGLTASHIAGTALSVMGVKRDAPSIFST